MVAIIPPVDVSNPTPAALRYGLFQAATGPLDLPRHGRGGGTRYHDPAVDLPVGFEVTCAADVVTFTDGCGRFVTGLPFEIQATMHTGSVGMPQAMIRDILLAQLLMGEQSVVEQIFSEGLFAQANSLSNNATAPTVLAAAATVRMAMGQVDEWLASVTSRRGIIHVPAILAPWLVAECSVYREGGRYYTPLGNVVSLGNYSGKDKDGVAAAAGHTNIYACESTTVWRTPDNELFLSPYEANLDLAAFVDSDPAMQNQIQPMMAREYVVTHNNTFAVVDVTIA